MNKASNPPCPVGKSPKFFFMQAVWQALWNGRFPFGDSDTVKFSWENGVYYAKSAAAGRAGGGFKWQTPNKELDPTVSVAKDVFVYISPGNPLATAGLTDLTTGTVETAPTGIWQAVKAVPAQTAAGGVTSYNVPMAPVQGATAGSPLKGDLDNAAVFWVPWAGIMNCG